jgi:hypothetical protein
VKGPRLTERDLAVLRFIAEQRAMRGDVVRRLLAAHGGVDDLTARTLLRHVGRWERLGLVRREPIPGAWMWLYLTRRGDARVGWAGWSRCDLGDRKHLDAVMVTRLALEADRWSWSRSGYWDHAMRSCAAPGYLTCADGRSSGWR